MSHFPIIRSRRLRTSAALRQMVEETTLDISDFIYPMFVRHGSGEKRPISSMPGQAQMSVDILVDEIKRVEDLGIKGVLLFGIPETKDATGCDNYNPDGVVPQAIRAIKETSPEMLVVSDMCFCEYTDHGHCGIVNTPNTENYNEHLPEGYLLNDETLELLAKASVVHAQSGADMIAPSGMVDGMVGAIRTALDENGLQEIPIISYSVKYASSFYGPFREAAEGAPKFGDRSQYQMDPRNGREALREVELDIAEGADIIMIKPALPYLDVIARVSDNFDVPIAAYSVSGEFAMIHAAAENGWLDLERTALEALTGIKRAGAKMIFSYFAKDAAQWLKNS